MKYLQRILLTGFLILTLSCVQETHTKTITFKVDMNAIENPKDVGIKGDFTSNPWNETAPLTDDNNDGIYEATFSQKTATNQIQFKFVNEDSIYKLQDLDNRILEFKYKPKTIIYEGVFNNPYDFKVSKD